MTTAAPPQAPVLVYYPGRKCQVDVSAFLSLIDEHSTSERLAPDKVADLVERILEFIITIGDFSDASATDFRDCCYRLLQLKRMFNNTVVIHQ